MLRQLCLLWVNGLLLTRWLHLDKTNIIKFITNNLLQYVLTIDYDEKYIEESINTKFLGSLKLKESYWPCGFLSQEEHII
jgi:hypothetical protein